MKIVEDRTRIGTRDCITFKKRQNEKNFLYILNGVECDSRIGKIKTQKSQQLSLNRFHCMNEATIAHELVHALGFDHEHNRPDRDDWVEINFNNVISEESNSNFRKLDSNEFRDFGTPYDYKSIMHYHSYAHALNKSLHTIRALKAPFEIEINENLSETDVRKIRLLYNCQPGISSTILLVSFKFQFLFLDNEFQKNKHWLKHAFLILLPKIAKISIQLMSVGNIVKKIQ